MPSIIIMMIEKINNKIFYQLLSDNWETIEEPLIKGAIVFIEPTAVRIRDLPID